MHIITQDMFSVQILMKALNESEDDEHFFSCDEHEGGFL